ncbi:MAG TPA: hypothetical protein VGL00_07015 [Terracidiphilus sp.]|jgi:hypothetical protein
MLRRIGLWALCGLAVGFLWVVYFYWHNYSAYHGGPPFSYSPATDTLIDITIPIRTLFGRHHAITWYWSMVLNAAIYASIGLVVESIRLTLRTGFARLRH